MTQNAEVTSQKPDRSKLAVITMTQPTGYPMSYFGLRQILLNLPEGAQFHILINGTEPGYAPIFDFDERCSVHEVPENLGVALGRNYLIERALEAGAEDILSLDDDFILPKNFFEDLLSARQQKLDDGIKVGIVSPALINFKPFRQLKSVCDEEQIEFPELHAQYQCEATSEEIAGVITRLLENHEKKALASLYHFGVRNWASHYFGVGGAEYAKGRLALGLDAPDPSIARELRRDPLEVKRAFEKETVEVSNLPGGASLYSKELIETIGMTDPVFSPFGYEDADFSIRARNAGFHNFTVPKAVLIHDIAERQSTRTWPSLLSGQARFQGHATHYLDEDDRLIAIYSCLAAEGRRQFSAARLQEHRAITKTGAAGRSARLWIDYAFVFIKQFSNQFGSLTDVENLFISAAKTICYTSNQIQARRINNETHSIVLRDATLKNAKGDRDIAYAKWLSFGRTPDSDLELKVKNFRILGKARHVALYPFLSDEFWRLNDVEGKASLDFTLRCSQQADQKTDFSISLCCSNSAVEISFITRPDEALTSVEDIEISLTASKWLRATLSWFKHSYDGGPGNFTDYVETFVANLVRADLDSDQVKAISEAILLTGRVDYNEGAPLKVHLTDFSNDAYSAATAMKHGSPWLSDAHEHTQQKTEENTLARTRKLYYSRWGEGLSDNVIRGHQALLKDDSDPRQEWLGLHNQYKGKRCFVIGNGPSLNRIDMRKLRDEHSIGVNSIFLHEEFKHGTPKHYVVEDTFVAEDRAEQIAQIQDRPCWYGQYLRGTLHDHPNVNWFNVALDYKERPDFPHFSTDVRKEAFVGGSVTYICMQIAYYLGFSNVYLIGFDHSYEVKADVEVDGNSLTSTSDDPNHFDPSYFGAGYRWHVPNVERMERGYLRARQAFEADGRRIYNATPGGKLNVFERVDFNSLF